MDEHEISDIIERTRRRVGDPGTPMLARQAAVRAELETPAVAQPGDGVFATLDQAVAAAKAASRTTLDLDRRKVVIEAVRRATLEQAEMLARLAVEETGLGRVDDKTTKNRLCSTKTPGPEDLEVQAVSGASGMTITEFAPFGVVGSISPVTNPAATVINNAISIISAGNAVVFNAHPSARRVSNTTVRLIHRAITGAGGPPGLITSVAEPTIESARGLMAHPDVRVLLVTGGPGVVREALKSDKRAITAGPGNPPVVVDETADVEKAGGDIVRGASFDNNIVCTDEKTVIAISSIADRLVRSMAAAGAYILAEHELRRLERVIFTDDAFVPGKPGHINTAWVGRDATRILAEIGVRPSVEPRVLVAEVPVEHPLVWTEQMMPVLPVVRIADVDAAIDLAVRSEHGFRHTASIHSTNVATITRMARAMNCSIFVANGPNFTGLGEGGEGFATVSIASPSGDGMTRPRTFSRERRVTVVGALRIV
ncbi:MAG: aldehyde dehydrogenase [Chloroflexota bacterium]|nr:aldehyde dehydrogenase [Chloroflexota bacterium]